MEGGHIYLCRAGGGGGAEGTLMVVSKYITGSCA